MSHAYVLSNIPNIYAYIVLVYIYEVVHIYLHMNEIFFFVNYMNEIYIPLKKVWHEAFSFEDEPDIKSNKSKV